MINFQVFGTVYSEFLRNEQFPLWHPFTSQGITADFTYVFTFTPAFYFAVFIGKVLSIGDTLLLFRFGLYIEEAIFLYGLYRASTLFHSHRITPVIISITGALSVSWVTQIHWNFHIIYAYPLLIYFTSRYLRGDGLEYAAYTLISMTLGGLFYTQIFIAATLCAFAVIWLLLLRPSMRQLFRFGSSVYYGSAILSLALVVAFLNIQFVKNVINGMQSTTPLRQPDGTIGLEVFLNYGGLLYPIKFMEFIYGAPLNFNALAYSGLFTVLFVMFAVLKTRSKYFWVFISLSALVLLFSLGGYGTVAELVHRIFPERYIGYVTPVAKWLLIIACGFGINYYLTKKRTRSKYFWVFISLSALVLLFSFGVSVSVAELAYRIFPEMDKFRHIGYVTPVAKILLIIASGFGIDCYLTNVEVRFRNTLILLILTIVLGTIFLLIDITHGWQYAYAVDSNLTIPFLFHWMQWSLVLMFFLFGIGFLRRSPASNRIVVSLLLCVLLGMGSYKFLLEWKSPTMKPEWTSKWQMMRHAYDVRPLVFSPIRQRESDQKVIQQLSMMAGWGYTKKVYTNSFGYGSLPVDLCFPVHRVDMVSTPFNALIKARLGISDAQPPEDYFTINSLDETLSKVENDAVLMKAIGCNVPKLYLTRTPILAQTSQDAERLVKASDALYESPVIQTSCGALCTQPSQVSNEANGAIKVRHFSANQLTVSVNLPSGSNWYLIYLDSLHPGWMAQVDGLAVPILPANVAFKAVELKPGRHEVMFAFTGGSRWSSVTIWTNFVMTTIIAMMIIGIVGRNVVRQIFLGEAKQTVPFRRP